MSIVSEFKEFAVKGNMVDLAVGVIIGGAFGKIVASLVDNIIMPPISLLGGSDFSDWAFTLKAAVGTNKPVILKYGVFFGNVLDFFIIAFVLFMVIKGINAMKRKKEEAPAAPAPPPAQEVLLTEIRDLLKKNA